MIIDNEKYTMADHIKKLCKRTKSLDIAVGYFYSNGFNIIEECLRSVDKVRIIMGEDTNQPTIDDVADVNSLLGKYVSNGKIEIRIYETDKTIDRKYHGKTWIFHGTNTAIIGSSNCSINGLQKNKELNTVVDIKEVVEWYNNIWEKSTTYDYKKLKVMEKIFKKPKDPKPETELESFTLHEYQTEAIDKVTKALETTERCKLIMACGTGKTLVSIKIMEKIVSNDGVCVYFVPSISLIPQTLSQFKQNGKQDYDYHAVCSDSTAVKLEDDSSLDELKQEIKSSTDEEELIKILKARGKIKPKTPLVIFTVYNSYDKTNKALEKLGIKPQLILYDEAHRTAGKKDGFASKALHDVEAEKKVFMTATPRTYKNSNDKNVNSMDDEEIYGHTAYNLSFTEAVNLGKLVPFRIVLPEFKKKEVKNKKLEEKEKMRALWKGIQYPNGTDSEFKLLQRVIAFHNTINASRVFAGKKKNNKKPDGIGDYSMENIGIDENSRTSVKHVDSTMSAYNRKKEINWIRDSNNDKTECRILSNARCLQEGVDIPALDGVAFLNPKRSPVDIIQAIGRVMRKPEGFSKDAGYVILPIPTFSGSDIEEQMRNNPTYKMVSNVISAMLAHDDKLASLLNQTFLLNKGISTGEQHTTRSFDEYLKTLICNSKPSTIKIIRTVMLDLVDKTYYPRYGINLGKKATEIEEKIKSEASIVKNTEIITKLQRELKDLINDSITLDDTRKILCQHAVLKPVFDELFPESKKNNPVSAELDKSVNKLDINLNEIQDIYDSIKNEMSNINDTIVKQNFIRELYDSFFTGADSKAKSKYGIVYTPVEVVDFILNSVSDVLKSEFGKTFSDDSVKVLDPFTGTGMFVTRLLQSGLISNKKLESKYKHDIHCNDIELLAYYTALANIETTYQGIKNKHVSFNNILYTDTFSQNPLYFKDKKHWTKQRKLGEIFGGAHKLLDKQKDTELDVIIGNPPYSGGQENANDDNQNTKHMDLEKLIKGSYVEHAPKGNTKGLYNSYIKAFRWASDRIGKSGIIGLVTPSSFINGYSEAGLRVCFEEEFTDIWCFDLLGQKGQKGHGRNIFEYKGIGEGGTTQGIVVTILVKNPDKIKTGKCTIHYTKLQETDYSGSDKRNRVKDVMSIANITDWKTIIPNKYHDWINQRDDDDEKFKTYMQIGNKNKIKTDNSLFSMYSGGIVTSRDAWVYNASKDDLKNNIKTTIDYCNTQDPDNFTINPEKVAWTKPLSKEIKKIGKPIQFSDSFIRIASYRPFIKHYLYFDPTFITDKSLIQSLFPTNNNMKSLTIMVPDKNQGDFSAILINNMPDINTVSPSRCFPLHVKTNTMSKVGVGGGGRHKQKTQSPHHNPTIIVSNKNKGEFSVFMTAVTPDLQLVSNGQCFPMKVMKK